MDSVISINEEVLSGMPVFSGTRVPVRTFLDYLQAGKTVDEFISDFPTITKAMTNRFLEQASAALLQKDA